jgi:5-methylcytosine-specific restriction endonuclease McrA
LLKDAATIQLPAPARSRDDVAIQNTRSSHCWACLSADRSLARHHIIPVANGGSDYLRNVVTICEACHSTVHGRSVLNTRTQPRDGLTSLADIAAGPEDQRRQWLDQFRRRVAAEKPRQVVDR